MEMISFRHNSADRLRLAAIHTVFSGLGLCIPENYRGPEGIEILYGPEPEGHAEFSIIIPKADDDTPAVPPYDTTYSRNNREIRFRSDIFSIYAGMISGKLEPFMWQQETARRKDIARTPFVDLAGHALLNALKEACRTQKIPLILKTVWPDNRDFAVCLTHDVDEVRKTYQWITYPARCIRDRSLKRLQNQGVSFLQKLRGREPYWTFDTLMKAERDRNVRSTLFFLQETGKVHLSDIRTWRHAGRRYRFRDTKIVSLLHTLDRDGWEVGLHGSFHSYTDPDLLKCEKMDLENVVDTPVTGIRQHNLNLEIPKTWLNQESAGLHYDTTLGFNDCAGFRWGTSFPFRYYDSQENRDLTILEIPLAIEDTAYFRYDQPWEEFVRLAGTVEHLQGVLTLLWHHSVFNNAEFPGWQQAYENMCDYCIGRNAWVTSGREIAEWWLRREKMQVSWTYEKDQLTIHSVPGTGSCQLTVFLPEKTVIARSTGIERLTEGKEYMNIRTSSNYTTAIIEMQ